MNIAIPMFGTRVSPRFDGAPSVLLVRVTNGAIHGRVTESMEHVGGWQRARLLAGHNVDVLLCGGIRQSDYFSIVNAGIEVYPGLMGEADEVLDAYLKGNLSKASFCGAFTPAAPLRRRFRAGRCQRGRGYGGSGTEGPNGSLTNRQDPREALGPGGSGSPQSDSGKERSESGK
jgi:predicted Fe-Mo cluster-binding NifX family protein